MFLRIFRGEFSTMTSKNRINGSDDPQTPADLTGRQSVITFRNRPFGRLIFRTLIRNRKESEKQLNLRFSLLQAIIEGADSCDFFR